MKADEDTVLQIAGEKHGGFADAHDHIYHLQRLREHMQDISDDPSGSEPELYLGEEDLETLEQFLAMAEDRGWPDAEPIIHMRGIRGAKLGLRAWTNSRNTAKAQWTKDLFVPKISDTQPGYVFARLNVMPTQSVAIGQDRKLYSKRGAELIRSRGIGWGALPEPEYLLRAIDPVTVLLNYDSRKDLANSLVSRIHPKNLPSARQ